MFSDVKHEMFLVISDSGVWPERTACSRTRWTQDLCQRLGESGQEQVIL